MLVFYNKSKGIIDFRGVKERSDEIISYHWLTLAESKTLYDVLKVVFHSRLKNIYEMPVNKKIILRLIDC